MFVVCRRLTGENRWCVLICKSTRVGKKVVQETFQYFGVAHGEQQRAVLVEQAKRELEKLNEKNLPRTEGETEIKQKKKIADPCEGALLGHMTERYRKTEGFHTVFGPVFDSLYLASLLSRIRYNQLRDVVIARIAEPSSKLRTAKILQNTFLRPLSEDQIYRLMDELVDLEDEIKRKVFEATQKRLGNQNVDLLLFDVTTLYFESQIQDELRDFGYSKDHKIGETQVVLALATTQTGSPIGYHLFQGKTAEVSTLLDCMRKWSVIFDIKHVIVVADRAMMSDDNLTAMENAGLVYIVAAKLKSLPSHLKETILLKNEELKVQAEKEEDVLIQEHSYKRRRLVIEYNQNRAHKDRKDRERLLQKVKKKLNKANKADTEKFITNRGYLKFVDKEKMGAVVLNEEKVREDERWDGLHGVITNDQENEPLKLLGRYRNLWVIEESFRLNKHTLSMRPIYHFTANRIKAHILICYLSFAITRYAHEQINIFNGSLSIENIRDSLAQVEVSILEDRATGQLYELPSHLGKEAAMIYRAMGLKRNSNPSKYGMFSSVV